MEVFWDFSKKYFPKRKYFAEDLNGNENCYSVFSLT